MIENRDALQLIGTDVIVSMGRLRSSSIFLSGEVRTAGSYSISALSMSNQALSIADGITNIGSLRGIQVLGGGTQINTFDVYDLMLKRNVAGDIRLQSGDVVFVPIVASLTTINGAVRCPGEYELLGGQSLGDLITMSGGLLGHGDARGIKMEQHSVGNDSPEAVDLDVSDDINLNFVLQDGDAITVPKVPDRLSNHVEFIGALSRPGIYAWREEASVPDYVKNIDADLLPTTDLGIGLIVRRRVRQCW